MGVNVFISPTIRAAGGNIVINPGVALQNYTLTSNTTGAGAITFPSDVTEFTTFAYGGGGAGGFSNSFTVTDFFGNTTTASGAGGGAGGGSKASARYEKSVFSGDLALVTTVGIAGVTSSNSLGSGGGNTNIGISGGSNFITTNGGQPGGTPLAIFAVVSGPGGAGGDVTTNVDITGWNKNLDINSAGGGGANGVGIGAGGSHGGLGGNVGGGPGVSPLTGSEGTGGPQPQAGTQASGIQGTAPGAGGSGASGSMFSSNIAGGAGTIGRIIITFIANSGATNAVNPFNLTGFTLTPGALV